MITNADISNCTTLSVPEKDDELIFRVFSLTIIITSTLTQLIIRIIVITAISIAQYLTDKINKNGYIISSNTIIVYRNNYCIPPTLHPAASNKTEFEIT